MPQRHKARQYALQMLFQWEIGRQEPRRIEDGFWHIARAEKNTRVFANELFEGVVKDASELDTLVSAHTENWRLERLSLIDRAILRLGVHELRSGKLPRKVSINQAAQLSKPFSSEDAPCFLT